MNESKFFKKNPTEEGERTSEKKANSEPTNEEKLKKDERTAAASVNQLRESGIEVPDEISEKT